MHSPPLLRINLVRKYIYDNGAIQIARAMEEGCAGCSHHNVSRSSNAQESIGSTNPFDETDDEEDAVEPSVKSTAVEQAPPVATIIETSSPIEPKVVETSPPVAAKIK